MHWGIDLGFEVDIEGKVLSDLRPQKTDEANEDSPLARRFMTLFASLSVLSELRERLAW